MQRRSRTARKTNVDLPRFLSTIGAGKRGRERHCNESNCRAVQVGRVLFQVFHHDADCLLCRYFSGQAPQRATIRPGPEQIAYVARALDIARAMVSVVRHILGVVSNREGLTAFMKEAVAIDWAVSGCTTEWERAAQERHRQDRCKPSNVAHLTPPCETAWVELLRAGTTRRHCMTASDGPSRRHARDEAPRRNGTMRRSDGK
jgi:hypothetical protein